MSYTWGPPDRNHQILANDAPIRITASLEIMLRHIQTNNETQTLWIDQLCIDQENTDENNVQVPLMKDIYRKASQTIIWLGPAENDSDVVMDFLTDVGKEAFEFGLMTIDMTDIPNLLDGEDEHLREISQYTNQLLGRVGSNYPISAFAALAVRTWFYRVWVMQEVARDNMWYLDAETRRSSMTICAQGSFPHVLRIENRPELLNNRFYGQWSSVETTRRTPCGKYQSNAYHVGCSS